MLRITAQLRQGSITPTWLILSKWSWERWSLSTRCSTAIRIWVDSAVHSKPWAGVSCSPRAENMSRWRWWMKCNKDPTWQHWIMGLILINPITKEANLRSVLTDKALTRSHQVLRKVHMVKGKATGAWMRAVISLYFQTSISNGIQTTLTCFRNRNLRQWVCHLA